MGPGESVRVTVAYLEDEGETPGPSRVEVLRADHDTGGRDRPDEEATYSHITSQHRGTEHFDLLRHNSLLYIAPRRPRQCAGASSVIHVGAAVVLMAMPNPRVKRPPKNIDRLWAAVMMDAPRSTMKPPMNMPARRPKRSLAGPAKNAPAQLPAT